MSEVRRQNRVSSIRQPATGRQKPAAGSRPATSSVESKQEASRQSATTGFTLMEVLVAIAILAVVVTTILASFNSVFSTTEALDKSAELYEMAKNCMKRITGDLESIHVTQRPLYKTPGLDDEPDPYRIVATTQDIGGTGFAQIRFTSRAHVRFEKSHRGGIAEIIYYIQSVNDGHLVLKRSDTLYPYPPFEEKGSDPVLCRYVKSLAFKFYDSEGSEYDVWDSESDEFGYATPKAIAVRLELANQSIAQTFETLVALPVLREKTE